MQQQIKFGLRTLAFLAAFGAHFSIFAGEASTISVSTEGPNSSTQQPINFPSMESAIAEIKQLNERISHIESGYEKEFAQARKLVAQEYTAKFEALADEISALRDDSESLADFDLRREKKRAEINFQRKADLLRLSPAVLAAAETAPLHARIDTLEQHEYVFGPESVEVELGEYDTKQQQYSVFAQSKNPFFRLRLKGSIPLTPAEAETFLKHWKAGLVHAEVKTKIISETPDLAFVNQADNSYFTFSDGAFMTAAARQELMERKYRPVMITLPAGNFDMGSKENMPVHRVTFKHSFAISKTEVTQEQWRAVMGNTSVLSDSCGKNCPVEKVSWNDAQIFIQKLNAKTGRTYRLPSEAEWEYACRAGKKQEFCGSDNADSVAWYGENSGSTVHPVATKQANAFGLHDMSGNALEWVEDSYHHDYRGAPTNGDAWQGDGSMRVVRGGSRSDGVLSVRATTRDSFEPEYRFVGFGFRLAMTLP
ncbi:MAG: hypothetical protein FD173_657 [Gallionellaceae bacterium]|nr:MAG: hypothetical protein FD173_657 [Gallionellaceae bacterium]